MVISELLDPDFFPFHVAFIFIFGMLFGSFFNVCIYRIPTGQALAVPGSYCYACGTHVRWYDNLPVVGYLVLGGRCRECRSPFSPRYALIELLTGFLFLFLFLQYRFCWALPSYFILTGLLLIATFTDVDNWIIPDRVSWGGAAGGILLVFLISFLPPLEAEKWMVARSGPAPADAWWGPVANSAVGALSGAGTLWTIGFIGSIVFRKPAMGLGDSKLLLAIGAFCGWQIAILCIFLASFFGSAQGLYIYLVGAIESARLPEGGGRDPEETLEIAAGLIEADDDRDADSSAPAYTAKEKVTLLRELLAPIAPAARQRHLKFGPHLALAAWMLMAYGQWVLTTFDEWWTGIYNAFGFQAPPFD